MLNKLRDAVIASVRLRASQGDCPTEPAHSVETLESVILDLAPAVDARAKVRDEGPMREGRVSLMTRAIRQSLRDYGHKVAESSLPECIAADVEQSLLTMRPVTPAPAVDAVPAGEEKA